MDDLEKILRRYEGAVNEVEGAGNDSDDAIEELEKAREGLLFILKKTKETLQR